MYFEQLIAGDLNPTTTISSSLESSVFMRGGRQKKEQVCTFEHSLEASKYSPSLSLQAALFKLHDNHRAFATDFSASVKE
jgi:hypothetical protein